MRRSLTFHSQSRRGYSSRIIGLVLLVLVPLVAVLVISTYLQSPTANDPSADKSKIDKDAESDKDKKGKPKADFMAMRTNSVPGDPEDPLRTIKPGHWTAANLDAKANNFDFKGNLTIHGNEVDGRPMVAEGTPFYLNYHRPAVLPKAQLKQLEVTMFLAPRPTRPWVVSELRDDASGIEVKHEQEQLQPMPGYQFNFLVMARQPDRYRYLTATAEVMRPVTDQLLPKEDGYWYRIVAPQLGVRAPLPSQSTMWTSIAYILWDGANPQIVEPDQQQALIDWLQWGGHLIISGPQSLDSLRGSFLEPYLPVTVEGSRSLSQDDLAEMADLWSIKTQKQDRSVLHAEKPWPGVRWALQPEGRSLPHCGELVAERCLGRGRILVTAFSLSQPELIRWRGFDGFFNGCLMRRSARKFFQADDGFRSTLWVDSKDCWDAKQNTHLRYFARDAAGGAVPPPIDTTAPLNLPANLDPRLAELYALPVERGTAAWNDFGTVPEAVRHSLREGAGITVPKPNFVLWILGLYLAVLVPVNWSLFRLLGRVEWAWAMTPVISIGFAALVIWMAQLDIGFARSSTELTIAELQGDYSRAHLSRYTALYASLSTPFDLHYEAPSAVAQPFAARADYSLLYGQTARPVQIRREEGLHLSGVEVSSNSTGLLHSESMWDVGGAITLRQPAEGPPEATNNTQLKLSGVSLLRRVAAADGSSKVEGAWVGDLSPGATKLLRFRPLPRQQGSAANADPQDDEDEAPENQVFYHRQKTTLDSDDDLNLADLVHLAEEPSELEPGEVRLIGWSQTEVPGLEIRPVSLLRRHATLVVAHLAWQRDTPPEHDIWLTGDTDRPGAALPSDDAAAPPDKPAP